MKKYYTYSLATAAVIGATLMLPVHASAFGGFGPHSNPENGNMSLRQRGEGLIPQELKDQFREEYQNLSEEEKAALHEERIAHREARQAERENFLGMSREEMREAHQSGKSMSEILSETGKTQAETEAFIRENTDQRINAVTERHDLTQEQEQTLKNRVDSFIQNLLGRWFATE